MMPLQNLNEIQLQQSTDCDLIDFRSVTTRTNIMRLPTLPEEVQPARVIAAAEEIKEDPKMIILLAQRIRELEAELSASKLYSGQKIAQLED